MTEDSPHFQDMQLEPAEPDPAVQALLDELAKDRPDPDAPTPAEPLDNG